MNFIKLNNFFLLASFLVLIQISIIEIHFGVYFLIFLAFYAKISSSLFKNILFLVTIFGIGLLSSFLQTKNLYDFVKDFAYFLTPVLSFVSGYLIAKKVKSFSSFLGIIIYLTTFFSIIHIYSIFSQIDIGNSSVSDIRTVGGISNIIEVFVLVIIIGSYTHDFLDVIKNKLLKKTILIIVFVSFFLYFSRTMFISLLIFILAIYGHLKITSKGLKYIIMVMLFFGLLYTYLFSVKIDRGKPGLESFLYKLKIAPSEIFTPIRKIDPNNHAYLWDHWRAYEATMAIDQINTIPTFFIGKGFGALVDLKFGLVLGDTKMRYIPTIHNGYVYVFFKTGILGLVFYLLFLINLYLYAYNKSESRKITVINYLIAGIGVHFLFTSLIINGVFNIEEIFVFILGSLFFFRMDTSKLIKEKE